MYKNFQVNVLGSFFLEKIHLFDMVGTGISNCPPFRLPYLKVKLKKKHFCHVLFKSKSRNTFRR